MQPHLACFLVFHVSLLPLVGGIWWSGGLELVGHISPDVVRAIWTAAGLLRGLLVGEEASGGAGGKGRGRPDAGVVWEKTRVPMGSKGHLLSVALQFCYY